MKIVSRSQSGKGTVTVYDVTAAERQKLRNDVAGLRRPVRKRAAKKAAKRKA